MLKLKDQSRHILMYILMYLEELEFSVLRREKMVIKVMMRSDTLSGSDSVGSGLVMS